MCVIWEIILRDFLGDILRTLSRLTAARMRLPELENLNPCLFESLRPRNLPDKKKRKIISKVTPKLEDDRRLMSSSVVRKSAMLSGRAMRQAGLTKDLLAASHRKTLPARVGSRSPKNDHIAFKRATNCN